MSAQWWIESQPDAQARASRRFDLELGDQASSRRSSSLTLNHNHPRSRISCPRHHTTLELTCKSVEAAQTSVHQLIQPPRVTAERARRAQRCSTRKAIFSPSRLTRRKHGAARKTRASLSSQRLTSGPRSAPLPRLAWRSRASSRRTYEASASTLRARLPSLMTRERL